MKIKMIIILTGLAFLTNHVFAQDINLPALKLQYDFPAQKWESEALPIGNGFIGAMLFGGVPADRIQVNEHSLWSGGPGANANYNGGHLRTAKQNHQTLQDLRNALQDKMIFFSDNDAAYVDATGKVVAKNYTLENEQLKNYINSLVGDRTNFGSYQSLGNINIAYTSSPVNSDSIFYTNYLRVLDIENAVSTLSYTMENVNYKREYFVSYPDNVIVVRLTADKPGKISRIFFLTTPQTKTNISATNNVITMEGQPADQRADGLKFAQQVKIIPSGGNLTVEDAKIVVENADEILLISSAATNYVQCIDDTFNYFSTTDPLTVVQATLSRAAQKTYEQLLTGHIADYKNLYNRMSLSISGAANSSNKTTDQLLDGYIKNTNTSAENRYLEQLYYQFGRYLLIASSRENSLPANLQGIWADGLTPPWSADYHTNINIQMNYWLAQQTNLSECHRPVIRYIKSLVSRGRYTANHYYSKQNGDPVRGWTINHENNIWGNTAPGNYYWGFYFPAAAAWMCQDIWEYFLFNQDRAFLEEYYPIMLDAALFWVDNLWQDSRDGTLVANPSYSPEHGPYSLGASSDQAIITELFDMVIKAYEVLHPEKMDVSPEIEEIITAKSLLAGPQIGLGGQFMEWKDELQMDITGDNGHRHANHLFWLHPGSQIIPGRSPQEDLFANAMRNTLNTRGDQATGWSKAWKLNFWARLQDGNRAHKLLEELLKGSTLKNLFDTHPPFQIDGNFGATAGMTEMLVQSQGGYIELFPALPDKWNSGQFKGIKARGNFELSANWTNGRFNRLEILSLSGKKCTLKYPDIGNYKLTQSGGGTVAATLTGDNILSFETTPGITYTLIK